MTEPRLFDIPSPPAGLTLRMFHQPAAAPVLRAAHFAACTASPLKRDVKLGHGTHLMHQAAITFLNCDGYSA